MNFTKLELVKTLTPEQIQIYSTIKNMQLKEIVMWVIIAGFSVVLIALIIQIFFVKTDWPSKAITATLDGVLGGTMYPLVNHFFPASKKAEEIEKKG